MKIKDEGDEGNTKHHQTCLFFEYVFFSPFFWGGFPEQVDRILFGVTMMIES